MSDFHDTPTRQKARKQHRCIACAYPIPVGEQYTQQSGFFDGDAYRNRYHHECWEALSEECQFEFMPGELDPPDRLRVSDGCTRTAPAADSAGDEVAG